MIENRKLSKLEQSGWFADLLTIALAGIVLALAWGFALAFGETAPAKPVDHCVIMLHVDYCYSYCEPYTQLVVWDVTSSANAIKVEPDENYAEVVRRLLNAGYQPAPEINPAYHQTWTR